MGIDRIFGINKGKDKDNRPEAKKKEYDTERDYIIKDYNVKKNSENLDSDTKTGYRGSSKSVSSQEDSSTGKKGYEEDFGYSYQGFFDYGNQGYPNDDFADKRRYPAEPKVIRPRFMYKQTLYRKLTIILIEETTALNPFVNIVSKIIESSCQSESDYYCIIKYGDTFTMPKLLFKKELKQEDIIFKGNITNEKSCLYDVVCNIPPFVEEAVLSHKEDERYKYMISEIEVVGIGTCTDNASKNTKKDAYTAFNKLLSRKDIKTKYCCTSDVLMQEPAKFGFRNIVCMSKEY